jgi:nucleotide-binding universal stress UspA family protein
MINTILLPSDFSQTSINAGVYALELAKHVGAKTVVVYHTYNTATEAEPMVYAQVVTEPFRQESKVKLNAFVEDLRTKASEGILIEAYHSHADLTVAVNEIAHTTKADLIVMGITGGGKLKETIIGSHSVTVAKHTHIPVIIVPTSASYKAIEKIVLLSDLKDVEETAPVAEINNLLASTHAKLSVLHIHTSNEAHTSEKEKLNALLGTVPEYHFVNSADFSEAVDDFVNSNQVDLVIVVPKKHGIFEGIFGVNHTKTLAFHSKVPLMVAHK